MSKFIRIQAVSGSSSSQNDLTDRQDFIVNVDNIAGIRPSEDSGSMAIYLTTPMGSDKVKLLTITERDDALAVLDFVEDKLGKDYADLRAGFRKEKDTKAKKKAFGEDSF